MARQVLDDGRWFDPDKAECFTEDTYWDGNNHVSRATGSQWDHEKLYRTEGGLWILHSWSQWQGSMPSWEEIDNDTAARWLVRNGETHPACKEEIASLEMR